MTSIQDPNTGARPSGTPTRGDVLRREGVTPPGRPLPYDRNRRLLRPHRRWNRANVALGMIAVVLMGWLAYGAWRMTRVDAQMVGIEDGAAITSEQAQSLSFEFVMPEDRVRTAGLDFDGDTVRPDGVPLGDGRLAWEPREPLAEGEHVIELKVDRPVLPPAVFTWHFTIDDTAPVMPFAEVQPVDIEEPFSLSGKLNDGERIWIGGDEVDLDDGNSFSLSWDRPPIGGPLEVRMVDAAGNETISSVALPPRYPEVRGAHFRAVDIADPEKFAALLALLDSGEITAVEIDLKDEYGIVGYDSAIPEVRTVGALGAEYDLEAVVDELHAHGAHVIGRLVAFNDPLYAQAAWQRGNEDRVVQTLDKQPLARNEGMFLNFASPEVRAYVSSIAVEAASRGVDDVLLDYVRRPDGDVDEMVFAGLTSTHEEAVAQFLAELQPELRSRGVYLGASVFGIAAVAPTDIAQDIPMMSDHLDYVAPMVYPSHFAEDNYNVPVPNADPYTIVARALADFVEQTEDHGIALVPWLQDFSFDDITYDEGKVRAQIDAACDTGIENHLLWNAAADYTTEALGACG